MLTAASQNWPTHFALEGYFQIPPLKRPKSKFILDLPLNPELTIKALNWQKRQLTKAYKFVLLLDPAGAEELLRHYPDEDMKAFREFRAAVPELRKYKDLHPYWKTLILHSEALQQLIDLLELISSSGEIDENSPGYQLYMKHTLEKAASSEIIAGGRAELLARLKARRS